ncbi:Glycine cleavage system T protein [Botrimarina colliarenosi]|uniref:Aminomethyltransferase n=1 Tax=Botrimarina colliarenosi TaxID=2528001 RepID=A0A5C6AI84_9BACT|nr:glycine cleavage system aminomethyltransferase GcvT [Botrimarina colliarenosi]TWT99106.1 Glycine cleavage system T protein [Botrimarina colliarenosi]
MSSPSADLLRTPLADWHAAHGGRLVDFAGWAMPVHYDSGKGGSIVDEHNATRQRVGLFDVSHMGRLTVQGPAAEAWLDGLATRRAAGTPDGRVRYSLVCNESGGVLDDILFTRVTDERFDLVVNASNRGKLLEWFAAHAMKGADLIDRTEATAMIAVQGPEAVELVASLADADVKSIRYYRAGEANVAGAPCVVSRTGYTGEDGFELIANAEQAETLWQTLIDGGATACGLAARDTLRLEAGMPLYGHELTEALNPLHAGLGFAVDFEGVDGGPRDFVGREALLLAKDDGSLARRVGLQVEGKRPPREEYRVLVDGRPCGVVTSGGPSPTLGYPIAMAYVEPELARDGTRLAIDVRGAETPAVVVPLPFYKRA